MARAKHFLVFLHETPAEGPSNEELLKEEFGEDRVYPLNGGSVFAVKTSDHLRFKEVIDRIGFNEDDQRQGIAVAIDPYGINGWYQNKFWTFINDERL